MVTVKFACEREVEMAIWAIGSLQTRECDRGRVPDEDLARARVAMETALKDSRERYKAWKEAMEKIKQSEPVIEPGPPVQTIEDLAAQVREAHGVEHLTIFRFTTGWKVVLGTVDLDNGGERGRIWNLPTWDTLADALKGLLAAAP